LIAVIITIVPTFRVSVLFRWIGRLKEDVTYSRGIGKQRVQDAEWKIIWS
jgi:hypothetical protein